VVGIRIGVLLYFPNPKISISLTLLLGLYAPTAKLRVGVLCTELRWNSPLRLKEYFIIILFISTVFCLLDYNDSPVKVSRFPRAIFIGPQVYLRIK
jgi:hypothetical protein